MAQGDPPPLGLTRSQFGSTSRPHDSTTLANASLISITSRSSMPRPVRRRTCSVAGITPVSISTGSTPASANPANRPAAAAHPLGGGPAGQQQRRRPVGDLARVPGRHLPVRPERRASGRPASPWRCPAAPPRPCGPRSRCRPARPPRPGRAAGRSGRRPGRRPPVGAEGEFVLLLAGQAPLLGDQLGRDALGDEAALVAVVHGRPEGHAGPLMVEPIGTRVMCSTPPATTSW